MEMTGQRQLTYPRDLSVQYSDKILMRINRPHNFQQTIDLSFEDFSRGRHTDVTFIPDDGAQVKVHGFLLSAASPFLRDVLSNTFSPSLEYVLMVPGVKPEVVSCLAQLLYGATVVTCKKSLDQLSDLLNLLGVQLSLVSQPAVLTEQEQEQTEEMEEDEDDSSVAMLKYDDKNTIPTSVPGTEETVETVGELPLCCYHCSLPFSSFETLNSHICTQASTGRRHHRCNQCGAVLSSMWRLRQHLATHSLSWGRGKTDHMYGRSSRRVQSKARPQAGDHGYAGADHRQEAVSVSSTPPSSRFEIFPLYHLLCTFIIARVQSEHSYGTKRDSSPEGTEAKLGADYNRSDHIYSADAERDDEETDTDNEMTDKPPGEDHQYFSSPERERSSPRFRLVSVIKLDVKVSNLSNYHSYHLFLLLLSPNNV